MRKTEIKPGFYWVEHAGELTTGRVRKSCCWDDDNLTVTFVGSSAVYHVGKPDRSNPTRVEPRRFKQPIEMPS